MRDADTLIIPVHSRRDAGHVGAANMNDYEGGTMDVLEDAVSEDAGGNWC